jgi:signal transduction histidine kinase
MHTYDQQYGKASAPNQAEVNSLVSIPLIVKDSSIGVLTAINKRDGNFTAFDLELLSSFAGQVAIYIVNTQLFVQSDLVSELVHEIRTPLVSLNMAIHLLQRQDLPEEKRHRIFEMINTEFNRLSDMTSSLLEYARLESGRTKFNNSQFDLRQVLSEGVEVMQFQADARGISISMRAGEEPLILTGDRDRLKQVVLNLLNNAIKYNHPGGSVTITAQRTPTDFSINIHDDGQGIPEEYMSRLFTRFFRAPNKENQTIGTGLGLSICKQIVEAHHGRLEVVSEVDHGSTFTLRLPVTQEEEFIPVD